MWDKKENGRFIFLQKHMYVLLEKLNQIFTFQIFIFSYMISLLHSSKQATIPRIKVSEISHYILHFCETIRKSSTLFLWSNKEIIAKLAFSKFLLVSSLAANISLGKKGYIYFAHLLLPKSAYILGHPKTVILYRTNGKLIVLGFPILKHIRFNH